MFQARTKKNHFFGRKIGFRWVRNDFGKEKSKVKKSKKKSLIFFVGFKNMKKLTLIGFKFTQNV